MQFNEQGFEKLVFTQMLFALQNMSKSPIGQHNIELVSETDFKWPKIIFS